MTANKNTNRPFRRLINWITAPTLLHGIVLGVSIVLAVTVVWQLEKLAIVLLVVVFSSVLLLIGILIGSYLIKRKELESRDEMIDFNRLIKEENIQKIFEGDSKTRAEFVATAFSVFSHRGPELFQTCVNLISRVVAFGRLFALLGVGVSIAIFVATYLQVEKLNEQNRLLRLDSLGSYQNVATALRSSISNSTTMASFAEALNAVLVQQLTKLSSNELQVTCRTANSTIRDIVEHTDDHQKLSIFDVNLTDSSKCFHDVISILNTSSEKIHSDGITSVRVTGLRFLSRDLAEEFLLEFSAACDTTIDLRASALIKWKKMNSLIDESGTILQFMENDPEVQILRAGNQEENLIFDSIKELISLSNDDINLGPSIQDIYVKDTYSSIIKVTQELISDFKKQQESCLVKASVSKDILNRLSDENNELYMQISDKSK